MIIFPEDVKLKEVNKTAPNKINGNSLHHLIDYPDHFVSSQKKKGKTYIKTTLDYYANLGKKKYNDNYKKFSRNYDLINGIISAKDLYMETKDDIDSKSSGLLSYLNSYESIADEYRDGLPDHVRCYSVITQPVNFLIGELSNRPDTSRPKSTDDHSKSEMFQYMTELFTNIFEEKLKEKITQSREKEIAELEKQIQEEEKQQAAQLNTAQEEIDDPQLMEQLQQNAQNSLEQKREELNQLQENQLFSSPSSDQTKDSEKIQELQTQQAGLMNSDQPQSKQKLQQIQQEIEQQVAEELSEKMKNYTSLAEYWASVMIESCKLEFNMKEKSEIAMKDLLATSGEFFHIREDKSDTGLMTDVLNSLDVWGILPNDEKYTINAEAVGFVSQMSINQIIKEFDLEEDEVDLLRDQINGNRIVSSRGVDYSAHYLGDSMELDEGLRFPMATEIHNLPDYKKTNKKHLSPYDKYSQTFTVHTIYFEAFKKIGKLVCLEPPIPTAEDLNSGEFIQNIDPATGELEMREVTKLVDESYKPGSHPYELSIEWEYETQIFKGAKIGDFIYKIEEFELLPYMPIIGVIHNSRNSEAKSFVDTYKEFQSLYTLLMNQIWSIANKDFGIVIAGNARHIPTAEDTTNEDAVSDFIEQIHEDSLVLTDDSIKNTKIATQNTNPFRVINASRAQEMQSRIQLAQMIKEEANSLVGFNRQRFGDILASDTVGGINAAQSKSYAQTEPIFLQHEYVLNQVYQGIIDAALYIVSFKQESSLLFVNEQGHNELFKVDSELLRGRTIKLFFSSREKDAVAFQSLQQLAQPYLQNGGDLYDVSLLYTTNSIRYIQDVYKKLKDKRNEMEKKQQQIQQQQVEQQQAMMQEQAQRVEQARQDDLQIKKYEIDTKANTAITVARLNTYFRSPSEDFDSDNVPDTLEIEKQAINRQKMLNDKYYKEQQINGQAEQFRTKSEIEKAKLDLTKEQLRLKKEEIESKERIAKENQTKAELQAKGRITKK